jgi:hemolysin-activating ACP:hemolysin acyltransferase
MVLTREQLIAYSIELFLQSPSHKRWSIGSLETYLLLPIKYNRLRVYMEKDKPVGLVTWCWMSSTDSSNFLQDNYHPSEEDFQFDDVEGKELWGLELIAPYGHTRQVIRLIYNEIGETYGKQPVNWRRFHSRDKQRTKRFG